MFIRHHELGHCERQDAVRSRVAVAVSGVGVSHQQILGLRQSMSVLCVFLVLFQSTLQIPDVDCL